MRLKTDKDLEKGKEQLQRKLGELANGVEFPEKEFLGVI